MFQSRLGLTVQGLVCNHGINVLKGRLSDGVVGVSGITVVTHAQVLYDKLLVCEMIMHIFP